MSLDAAAYQRAAAHFGETIVELSDEEFEVIYGQVNKEKKKIDF